MRSNKKIIAIVLGVLCLAMAGVSLAANDTNNSGNGDTYYCGDGNRSNAGMYCR